jgi:hypothetical protein
MYYIMGYSSLEEPMPVKENSLLFESRGLHDSHGLHDSRASHTTTWLNGDPNQISYSALRNTEDIDLITMDPFAEDPEFRSVNFV